MSAHETAHLARLRFVANEKDEQAVSVKAHLCEGGHFCHPTTQAMAQGQRCCSLPRRIIGATIYTRRFVRFGHGQDGRLFDDSR
jgi:hypothetical protein